MTSMTQDTGASDVGERLAGARLTIDLSALADNWRVLNERADAAECGAAVKGDGYGIGIHQATDALARAGCRTFFVALPQEGIAARSVAPGARIFVLDGLMPGTGPDLLEHNLTPVVGSFEELAEWQELSTSLSRRLPIALHVDSGMNRLGFRESDVEKLTAGGDLLAGLDIVLVISHLACASDPEHPQNDIQLRAFNRIRRSFPGVPASLANSAGVLLGPEYHFDLVRPGIALYGAQAFDDGNSAIHRVVTLEARVLTVRDVPAGEGIGYGGAQKARRDSRVAIVAAGYADGYHRRAGSSDTRPGAHGLFREHNLPLIGRISMDLAAFDVTDLGSEAPERGDWVTLYGDEPTIDRVAGHAETIGYELLTSLGRRCHRIYRDAREL